MELKHFIAISAYILALCDGASGASGIINVTLVDGLTPNEGRIEYLRSGNYTWTISCGSWIGTQTAPVVCRQLGYPGANNFFYQSPFGTSTSIAQFRLDCGGEEESLADCSPYSTSLCSIPEGVICYERGYIGCYPYPAIALEELQTPSEYGLEDSQNLTIPNCVSLCYHTCDIYTYAGLYNGDMCLCGNASTINQSDRVSDWYEVDYCSSPCAGRNIESCGGSSYIALFNISTYIQQSMSNIPGNLKCGREASSAGTGTAETTSATETTTSQAGTGTAETTSATETTTSQGTFSLSENLTCPPKPECSSSKGVQICLIVVVVALLLHAVAISVLHIQLRRTVRTRTGKNGPDPYMDLQPRPETGKTYQEMAITSTASSKTTEETRLPSSDLFYENQNVAQYASKIKEGAMYETVLTPN